jgi:hypothetical protein
MLLKLAALSLLIAFLLACQSSRTVMTVPQDNKIDSLADSTILSQRALLKGYALCRCLLYSYPQDSTLKSDISLSFYYQTLLYSDLSQARVDRFVKTYADGIKPSDYVDYAGRKAAIFSCTELYNSRELDSLVRTLDSAITR